MNDFAARLKTELLKGLPGTDIQWQMASSDRFVRNFPRLPGSDARVAAVLVLLYPATDSIHTVLMQRPDYNGVHGGQISFPGGKKEPGDEDVIHTALREASEEAGIDPSKVFIIGTLTPLFIPVSNMLVSPVLGWMNEKPVFHYKPEEVEFLIDADIKRFLDPSVVKSKPIEIRGEIIEVKYFDYDSNVVWGATAMILNEFLFLLTRGGFSLPG
jgi:8-oxo-dGTP pyrophosphatase MutT (NUDIX family)